jgi:hypothetical protein
MKRMGEQPFNLLMVRAHTPGRRDDTPILRWLKQEMKSNDQKTLRTTVIPPPVNDCLRQQYARIIFTELYKQTRKLLDTRRQR